MRFTFTTVAAAITTSTLVSAHSRSFGITKPSFFNHNSLQQVKQIANAVSLDSTLKVPRGGSEEEVEGEEAEEVKLYLPGLLEATVGGKWVRHRIHVSLYTSSILIPLTKYSRRCNRPQDVAEASRDCTVTISPSKAKELSLKSGSIVGVVGRRRRASYAVVEIAKGSKGSIQLSYNLANNLRVRDTDKVKVVPLGGDNADEFEATSGDMALLAASPEVASSVTFSPVKDSLHSLELSEGGDELSEDEIMSRFLKPYLNMEEGVVVLKKGHTLVLRDDNRKTLEFTVTHLGFGEEEEGEEEAQAEDDGKNCLLRELAHLSY